VVVAVDVHKYVGALRALDGVSLEVAPAEIVCVIGPSGSGKSTFLRCINQLERVDGGAIWVDGALAGYRRVGDALHPLSDREIAHQRLSSGMVFQRFNLFGHLTALDNVIEGPVTVSSRRGRPGSSSAPPSIQARRNSYRRSARDYSPSPRGGGRGPMRGMGRVRGRSRKRGVAPRRFSPHLRIAPQWAPPLPQGE